MSKYFDPFEQRSNSAIYHNYMERWEETSWMKRAIGRILTWLYTFITSLLCLFLLSSCDWHERDYYDVEVTNEQFHAHFIEFQSRYLVWQTSWGLPSSYTLPDEGSVYRRNRIVEFRSTEDTTCYFTTPDLIQIGDDKWESGCVAHEIGHAALYMINHPCWGEFEHDFERVKCQERFR